MPRERVAGAFRLRDLVLVVREHEIVAAAVDVEAVAEDLERHRRALDVPAGPARSPGRIPLRLSGLRGLPEREVDRAALLLVDLDARARALEQLFERAMRQRAVRRQRVDLEVHALAFDDIGVAARDELRDQLLHLVDELGRVRDLVGPQDVEAVELFPVVVLVLARELGFGRAPFRGAGDDPVFDVGDVLHVGDAIAEPAQVPADRVEGDRSAAVADVRRVVRRRPAHVHRHGAFRARHEVDLRSRRGVVDAEHALTLIAATGAGRG